MDFVCFFWFLCTVFALFVLLQMFEDFDALAGNVAFKHFSMGEGSIFSFSFKFSKLFKI